MALPVLTNLNMNGNQVLGLRLEVLAADPAGGALYAGRVWFNSTDNLVKFYDGSAVVPWGSFTPGSISDFTAPTADFSWGGFKITNLADPTGPQDAATRAYVLAQLAALIDSAPGTLDTLNELAAALGDDPNFAATLAASLAALDTRLDALEALPTPTHKFAQTIGDNSASSFAVTHGLGTLDVIVSVYETSTGAQVIADVTATSTTVVTVAFTDVPTTNQYRVVVVG